MSVISTAAALTQVSSPENELSKCNKWSHAVNVKEVSPPSSHSVQEQGDKFSFVTGPFSYCKKVKTPKGEVLVVFPVVK